MSSLLETALAYAQRRWRVAPLHTAKDGRCSCGDLKCRNVAKHPRSKNGLKDATTNEEIVRRWWTEHPDSNIAIVTGAGSGVVVLDVDIRHGGDDSLHDLIQKHGALPHTAEALTGGGGRHFFFKHPGREIRNSAGKLGSGLDIRGDGGYVVAPPSVHASGNQYHWEMSADPFDGTDLAPMPLWMIKLILEDPKSKRTAKEVPRTVIEGGRNDALTSLAGSMRRRGMSQAALEAALLAENRERCQPPLDEEEVLKIARSVARYPSAEPPTVRQAKQGANPDAPHTVDTLPPAPPESKPSTPPKLRVVANTAVVAEPDTSHLVIKPPTEDEATLRVDADYAAVCSLMRFEQTSMQIFEGRLEWNEMLMAPTVNRKSLSQQDRARVRERMQVLMKSADSSKPVKFAREDVQEAIDQVAHEKSYHPVRDYLMRLEWDQISRINSLSSTVLDIEQTTLNHAMLRRFMIGAVARVMRPGCKADNVLILHGEQGIRKSTFFAVLAGAGEDWFSDSAIDLQNKDSYMALRRCWILEWAELESMQRARDSEAVKSFLSSRIDHFRPPYGRGMISVPRASVIVGTTNKRDFLTDLTGNRRYWILTVRDHINVGALFAQRDQLWAEAVALYREAFTCESCKPRLSNNDRCDKHKWWLTDDEDASLRRIQRSYQQEDAWEELVETWINDSTMHITNDGQRLPITMSRVLNGAVKKMPGQWAKGDEIRVGRILKRLGYERASKVTTDDGRREYTYTKTTGEQQDLELEQQ